MAAESTAIADLLNANVLSINDGYRAKNSELSKVGIPFARAQNINNGFHFEDADCFPLADLPSIGNKISAPGDVVFTSKGTVGRFALVRDDTPRFVYAPQLCFWRSHDRRKIEPRWLYYWMHSREFFVQFKGVAGQTDMAEYVSLGDQRRMHISLPPLPEQRAIAGVLGALDDKIEVNRKTARVLEGIARAVFTSWFVDFDPVRRAAAGQPTGLPADLAALFPKRLVDSPIGEVPEGWEVKAISEVSLRVTKGDTPRAEALQAAPAGDRLIPMLRVNAITENGEVSLDQAVPIPESIHLGKSRRSILEANDILYTNAGTIGRVALVQKDFLPANTNQAMAIIRPNPACVPPAYLYMVLRHPRFQAVLHYDIVHAVQANLALGKISAARAVFPPFAVMARLSEPITTTLERVFLNRRESRTLAALRDALLPKLISGELRIADAEKIVGRAV